MQADGYGILGLLVGYVQVRECVVLDLLVGYMQTGEHGVMEFPGAANWLYATQLNMKS